MRRFKDGLTFSNVTASLALFIALGGTSYAAITLPRNSVGTNQLRTGAIRSVDVKDRSLEARDLSLAARRFLKGQKGERGERGERGPAGSDGTTTTTGGGGTTTTTTPAGLALTIRTATVNAAGDSDENSIPTTEATVDCPPGQKVTGGGVNVSNAEVLDVHDSHPIGSATWSVSVGNDAGTVTQGITVYAICAS